MQEVDIIKAHPDFVLLEKRLKKSQDTCAALVNSHNDIAASNEAITEYLQAANAKIEVLLKDNESLVAKINELTKEVAEESH